MNQALLKGERTLGKGGRLCVPKFQISRTPALQSIALRGFKERGEEAGGPLHQEVLEQP